MLTPYTPKLSTADALHVMRRLTMSVNQDILQKIQGKTAAEAYDFFVGNAEKNPQPTAPAWLSSNHINPFKVPADQRQVVEKAFYDKLYKQYYDLKYWWAAQMKADTDSLREKMTLFWHGHFTTRFDTDHPMTSQLVYAQQDMLRKNAFGNFRTLLEKICMDGAMLIFLNGRESKKDSPNENFSRELLELYSMGIGNYTETDVKEGARVFTGFNVNVYSDDTAPAALYETYLNTYEHDYSPKTYFGKVINNDSKGNVFNNEIKKVVDIILSQKAEAVSKFISEKVYKFFVFANPADVNKTVVADMAKIMIDSNWEIKPVLKALFTSTYFYSDTIRASQPKNPAENIVGITRHFDVKDDWKDWVMTSMGMELMNPPNVAGWPGYRKWMDSRTLPFAVQQMGYFMWNQTNEHMLSWIKQFKTPDDSKILIEQILTLFFAKLPSEATVGKYQKIVLAGSPDYEWPAILKNTETAGVRLKMMFIEMIKSPYFHLN